MEMYESERIAYRSITLDDTQKVLRWRNCDEVRKNFFYQSVITPKEHEEYYNTRVRSGEVRQFVMKDKETDTEFGCVYFSHVNIEKKTAEGGLFIGDSLYRGKGYGTEAYKWLKEFGFFYLGITTIYLRIRKENLVSVNSASKAGFKIDQKLTDEYYVNGGAEDLVFLSIYRNEN